MLPLDGLRVVDVGTLTPGKYCSFLLAQLGAEVIRVERPQPAGPPAQPSGEDRVLNRNKRSIALDLTSPDHQSVLAELCRRSDILIEANRPGVAARLGFGVTVVEDACRAIDLDGSLAAAMAEMAGAGVEMTTSAELLG